MQKRLGWLVGILLVLCTNTVTAWGFGPQIWLREDFRELNPAWEPCTGVWSAKDGYLTGAANGSEATLGFSLPCREEFTAIWQVQSGPAGKSGFRITALNGPDLQVTLAVAENMVKLETLRPDRLEQPDLLAARPFKLRTHTWTTVKAVIKADLYVVKINGVELIRYPVTPGEFKSSGRFFLFTQGETRFQRLTIREVRQTDSFPWGTQLGSRSSSRSGGSCCRK